MQVRDGWLCGFRDRFGLKNGRLTLEAVSADEVTATFLAELKEFIKEKASLQFDEARLPCKKMICIHESVEEAPWHKSWKDVLDEVEELVEGHEDVLTNEELETLVES